MHKLLPREKAGAEARSNRRTKSKSEVTRAQPLPIVAEALQASPRGAHSCLSWPSAGAVFSLLTFQSSISGLALAAEVPLAALHSKHRIQKSRASVIQSQSPFGFTRDRNVYPRSVRKQRTEIDDSGATISAHVCYEYTRPRPEAAITKENMQNELLPILYLG